MTNSTTQALIIKPQKALEDEAKALTSMMDALSGPQFGVQSAARQTAVRAFEAACVQMGIQKDDLLTPQDVAQVGMSALRNLVLGSRTADVAIKLIATQMYNLKVWLALGMASWSEYVDATLMDTEDADKWKSELGDPESFRELLEEANLGNLQRTTYWLKTLVPTVLNNAKEHPVELEDGTKVDDEWIATKAPTLPMEMAPLTKRLDMSNPKDVAKFQEVLKTAATLPREEFRSYKKSVKNGKPVAPPQPVRVEAELIEVVDTDSGEIIHRWRVPEMVFENEADWNFFWMALKKRYDFVIQTKTEKVNGKSKNASQCRTGRRKPVSSVSRRNGER